MMKDMTKNDAQIGTHIGAKLEDGGVILQSEWSRHALQQRRLQWVALGQVFGEQIDNYFSTKAAIAATVQAEAEAELECLA